MPQGNVLHRFLSLLRNGRRYVGTLRDLYLIRSSRLFDRDFYLKNNADIAETGMRPELHYLHNGGFEGRDPSPSFSSSWYMKFYEGVRESGLNPLIHYLRFGRARAWETNPEAVMNDLSLIRSSDIFNEPWYLATYPDVAEAKFDPATHYLLYGAYEGRDPGPRFCSKGYLDNYRDIRKEGVNPLVHYLKYGQKQGRNRGYKRSRILHHLYLIRFSRLFDRDFYLKNNPDIARTGAELHYLHHGGFEGRDPSPSFSSSWYLSTYEDVRKSGINPLVHYLRYGRARGRPTTPTSFINDLSLIQSSDIFNELWYRVTYPDVAEANFDPATHYLLYGAYEGRDPGPNFHSKQYLDSYSDVGRAGLNPLVHFLRYGQQQGRTKGYEKENEVKTFVLCRLQDYSRQAGDLIFEDIPEQIYMQRPKVVGQFSGELGEGNAFCPPAYISRVENAGIFGGSSLVIVDQEKILSDELVDFDSDEIGIKSPLVKYRQKDRLMLQYKKSSVEIKEGALISCDHDVNYFHWITECLPKLVFLDSFEQFDKMPLLIYKGLHKNLMEALRRVNTNNRELIYLEPCLAYQVQDLIYPSALSRVVDRYQGRPIFNQDVILSHKWISKVPGLLKGNTSYNKKPWRKLYLTRRKGLRTIENRAQVEQVMRQHGFEIVDLDGPSLDDQIQLFSQASMIVAPTGAALTNLLFCQPGTRVIILMSNHEVTNYYFWPNLAAINNLNVITIACQRSFKLTNYWSVHDDYEVDVGLVLEEIRKSEN